jgi:hypothetical protein
LKCPSYLFTEPKLRIQLLFALLYLLGLRINEVASHTWGSLQQKNNTWWFFVKGKGGKLGQVPANKQLMQIIQYYRLHLGKSRYPELNENEYILISAKTKRPLGAHQLYNLVKTIGIKAAAKTSDVTKQQKLSKLSPHWLRHLSASHQDKAGIPARAIQANHRHSSFATTQIYLHAEDELRSSEMEKMQINLAAIKLKSSSIKAVKLQVQLKGNNIIGADGLQFLLKFIANSILHDYSWQQNQSDLVVLSHYQRSVNKEICLVYEITNINKSAVDLIADQIKMAAKLRLFSCRVTVADNK